MSDSNEFDDLFQETPREPMTEARVRQIASDQHYRELAAMQQAGVAAGQRRAEALERAERRHPGFQSLYNNPEVASRYIKERPRSAGWLGLAEVQGSPEDIDEFYDSFYNEARNYETTPQQEPSTRVSKQAPAGPFTLTEINALPLPERHQKIQSLLERIGDEPLDSADPSAEVFRVERGEQ